MKTIAGLALATLAAAGILAVQGDDDGRPPVADAGEGPGSVYILGTSGGSAECALELVRPADLGATALRPAPGCDEVHPDLARARYWREDADGSIVFLSQAGESLLTFGLDDGPGYLSYEPASAHLRLAAAPR